MLREEKNIKSYTAEELRKMRSQSRTDWKKVDAATDEETDDMPDWTKAGDRGGRS